MAITLDELIFDPANPDDGANVGATLRGADGTVIGNTGDALKVTGSFNVDGSTVELGTATLAALEEITVSATDFDIRDLAFATDKVDVTGSEVSLDAASLAALENITVTVDNASLEISNDAGNPIPVNGTVALDAPTLAALENITVSATDLDIRDLSFATDSVNVSGSQIQTSCFQTLKHSAQSVTTTASQLAATPLTDRCEITIQNIGNKAMYVGSDNTVTASTGVKIPAGGSASYQWGASATVWAISEGTSDVRLMEASY